jgi:hypothetical protein
LSGAGGVPGTGPRPARWALGVQRRGDRQGRGHPALATLGRGDARRGLAPAGRGGIRIELAAPPRQHLLRALLAPLQAGVPAERRRTGRGPHPHAVLGDALQARHAGPQQRGEAVDQQPFQYRAMPDPEVGQRLVIDADAAAQPLVRQVLRAQPGERAGAADPLQRRVQPQRHQQLRVGRRMARPAFDRLDGGVQRRQIQPFDEAPHQAHPVIGRHQLVQAHRPPRHLPAFRPTQPRPPPAGRAGAAWSGSASNQARSMAPTISGRRPP